LKPHWKIVIVAIILAAIVIIASLLYIWFWWDSSGSGRRIPTAMYSKTPVSGGWQVNIVSITNTVIPWDDIRVQLNDGTDSVGWSIKTDDLDGGFNITAPYAAKQLGALSVTLTVTDAGGNGFVSGSDCFTVTANPVFSSVTTYTAVLIYEPFGEPIGNGITSSG